MDKIVFKEVNTLESRNMEKCVSGIKVEKGTNTTNKDQNTTNKDQKSINLERLFNLICFVVLFTILFRCAVAIAGTSIRPTKPREVWTMVEKYNCIIRDFLCICLFSNAAALLHCIVLEACWLVRKNAKTPNRSLSCFLYFGFGFICLLVSEHLVMEQQTRLASDPSYGILLLYGILLNVCLTKYISSKFDDEDKFQREYKTINKPQIKKGVDLFGVV